MNTTNDFVRVAMGRGTVVVDECVQQLAKPLEMLNIHVFVPLPGESDFSLMRRLVANRILITRNTSDFEEYASSYDFGIIDLSKLRFIDPEQDPSKNKTVQLISRVIQKESLWSLRHGFKVTLHDDGTWNKVNLVD